MAPVMNDTKWNELRLAMYELDDLSPLWRVKDLSGYLCPWDGDWFYHFRTGGYDSIEWVEIQITSPAQDSAVLKLLREIHLPGHRTDCGFRVYGFIHCGTPISYI
ncbi:DUF6678 family protein [Schlesneria sp. DSM 10557]|uniref:DUF6678 family protein n=1 Tax=Schlesneria sp. DSM 10557 TaxID=3044399 RepID=UPI0035C7AA43